MICTIENTSSVVAEKVEITNEWEGGANAEMQGASGEYTVDAGSTEEFVSPLPELKSKTHQIVMI